MVVSGLIETRTEQSVVPVVEIYLFDSRKKNERVTGKVNSNIHLPPPLGSGDIAIPLLTKKGGTNLREEHGLERISGRGLKALQPANPKYSGFMCLCFDLRKWIFPAQVLELIQESLP